MQLPGLITIKPENTEDIKHAARILGTSFMEEPWFIEWLSALDAIGTSTERKREILITQQIDEFTAHAPYQGVYATDDFAAVAGGYLHSEMQGHTHAELEAQGSLLSALLTEDEARLLETHAEKMAPISDFSWAADAASGEDHIYFYGWAVDPEKRGSGAFRRLITPFYDFADERGINLYLECYCDRLQGLYEHVGFELIDVLSDPNFTITERRMVRKPGSR